MHDHLSLTLEEAVARKNKKYDADIKAYEGAVEEARKISDVISEGIIQQFPEQFIEGEAIGMSK